MLNPRNKKNAKVSPDTKVLKYWLTSGFLNPLRYGKKTPKTNKGIIHSDHCKGKGLNGLNEKEKVFRGSREVDTPVVLPRTGDFHGSDPIING